MKKRFSLKTRLMIMTSLLLVIISIVFTVFSIFNAYFNLIKPFEQLYIEQQNSMHNMELIQENTTVVLEGSNFFIANIVFMIIAIIVGCSLTYFVSKNSFSQLLDRLQNAFDREKRFSVAVAHELKTPLTVVKTNIDVLQIDETPDMEEYAETIKVIKKQNDRMIQLVHDLTLLSSSDIQKQNDLIEIDTILCEIENDLKSALESKHIKLEYNTIGFQMRGNALLIKHALSNLIENAIKYNTIDGTILVSQKIEESKYKISICDSGIGISEKDIPYIFEPFYRADKSRNRATGGSGLGLAITKEIIESHNGMIEYHAREPKGSEFLVWIPIE